MKKKATTEGLEWLTHSLTSFNGSGYADKSSPKAYLTSYSQYKAWKNDKNALELLDKYYIEALSVAEAMMHSRDAGHTPSPRQYKKFQDFISGRTRTITNIELQL